MLKRFYFQISLLMIVATMGLIVCFGAVVYVALARQLTLESKTTLQSEIREERETIETNHLSPNEIISHLDVSDDKGLSLYALVHTHSQVNYPSQNAPLSNRQVSLHAMNNTYVTFALSGHHYAMMATNIRTKNETVQLVMYQCTDQQSDTLDHVRDLLYLVGLTGTLVAVLIHLWIAKRALIPAEVTWDAHQGMMTEISHELQTPLATMSAIVNTHISGTVKEDLIREIDEASTMVKDILYLSKINSIAPEVSLQPIAVSDLTEEVVERFTPLLTHGNVLLEGRAQYGLYVLSTPEMWTRLVSTLLKNVVDHSEPGSTAEWSLTTEGNVIKLRIKNRTRTLRNQPQTRKDVTRGFGMQIVRRIVEEMQGSIDFRLIGEMVETTVTVHRPRT